MSPALFALGEVALTPGAHAALAAAGIDPQHIIQRHITGDWAEMNKHGRQLNQTAVASGEDRIFSAYTLPNGVKIWVITEGDHSYTTLLLPTEY